MSNRELISVAFKVFAIYILVQALLVIPSLVSPLMNFRNWQTAFSWLWLGGASAIVVALVLAILIWRMSSKILSDAFLKGSALSVPTQRQIDWEAFILSVLGIFLVVQALVVLGYRATGAYVQATYSNNPRGVAPETVALLVCYTLQGLLGVTLIIRSKGWAKLLRRFREFGVETKSSDEKG